MKNQKDRKGKKKGKKSLIPSFLTKLYQILENTEYHDIVKWADNGKAFIVKNLPEFIEVVLPNYFKHNNFASFVRQLNMYDFHKTRNNNNENTFYHKLFIKGQKNLLKMIKRKINSHSYQSTSDDTELSEMMREERESKLATKRSMEDFCTNMVKNMDELSKRFNETEKRIDSIARRNDEYLAKNKSLINDLTENKNYSKNLESLVFFILDFFLPRKTLTKEKLKEFFKNDEYMSNMLDSYGEKLYNLIEKDNHKKMKESKFKHKKSIEKSKFKDFKSVKSDMFDETNSLSPCMLSSPTISDDYSYMMDNDIFTPKKENYENFIDMNNERDKNNIFHF